MEKAKRDEEEVTKSFIKVSVKYGPWATVVEACPVPESSTELGQPLPLASTTADVLPRHTGNCQQ